jgi:LysM repeat protein
MAARSPARFLAPLALVGTAVALFVVVNGPPDSRSDQGTTGARPAQTATPASSKKTTGRRRYTVQRGDTASGIAEQTGVSLAQLRKLNPKVELGSLSPGQRLVLRR